ncbi:PH domain-containing protein [Desulfocurvus sp. DL9XJH121]
MAAVFPVPIRKGVPFGFLLFIAAVAAATVWSLRSGFLWTGICLVAVTAPLGALFWWMLYVNPSRTRIMVRDGALLVDAPPFLKANQPLAAVSRAFVADMSGEPEFRDMEKDRCMAFFGYRSGVFKTASGREAVVVSRGDRVLCLDAGERWFLLGPADLDGLAREISPFVAVKD